MLTQGSLGLSSFFILILFPLFCSTAFISTILSFSSLIHSSASVIPLLVSSRVFFSPVSVLSITPCLFFSSSMSLLHISCIFSVYASILFPRSWIIFTNITLNYFQVVCLFAFHLVLRVLFCFFSLLLHLQHSSFISFCLIYCTYDLLSPGCRNYGSSCFCCPSPGEWIWSRGLCRISGERDWCLCSGG